MRWDEGRHLPFLKLLILPPLCFSVVAESCRSRAKTLGYCHESQLLRLSSCWYSICRDLDECGNLLGDVKLIVSCWREWRFKGRLCSNQHCYNRARSRCQTNPLARCRLCHFPAQVLAPARAHLRDREWAHLSSRDPGRLGSVIGHRDHDLCGHSRGPDDRLCEESSRGHQSGARERHCGDEESGHVRHEEGGSHQRRSAS